MLDKIDLDSLFKLQYGMYVVSSKKGDKINGQIATVVSQITYEPIQVVVCISKNTLTHEYIESSRVFGVSVLDQTADMKLVGRFGFKSGRDINKYDDSIQFEIGKETGCPLLLQNTVVALEAKVNQAVDVGSHTLFVADLLMSKQIKAAEAMTYEYYHSVMRGKASENAPTYQKATS